MSSSPIEESTKKRIGRLLAHTVSRYLEDKEHRREFEKWYFEKYGAEYQWKIGGVQHNNSNPQETA